MRNRGIPGLGAGATVAAVALVLSAVPAAAQQAERYEVAGSRVAIYNLAGEATLAPGAGAAVVVEVRRGGAEADRLGIERGPIGGAQTLRVLYPDDRILYRGADRGRWSSQLRVREDGTFGDSGDDRGRRDRGRRVEIRSSGDGLEAHADLHISVPRGQRLELYLAVGRIGVTNVEGELYLDGGATEVTTSHTVGALTVDVGSGHVRVADARGALDIDTGSGDVDVSGVSGDQVRVDTGSGGVTLRGVTAPSLNIDTGSGGVDATGVAVERVLVDTGSGSVDLAFSDSPRDIEIDTGSGGVTLTLPAAFTATVELETGSGGIDLDFPVQVQRWERDAIRGTIGDGSGRLVVETGSGGIRIRKG